ncbi:hypothetical protein D3C71_2228010 [compost metagenome]
MPDWRRPAMYMEKLSLSCSAGVHYLGGKEGSGLLVEGGRGGAHEVVSQWHEHDRAGRK